MFVSTLITEPERTPMKLGKKYALEGVTFDPALPNKVTDLGLQGVADLADKFSRDFGDLVGKDFNPESFFVRSQYKDVPMNTAYAFFMALFPETCDGVDIVKGYVNVDS